MLTRSAEMKEEKENLIMKFLGYFIGPVQFVMEVSSTNAPVHFLARISRMEQPL